MHNVILAQNNYTSLDIVYQQSRFISHIKNTKSVSTYKSYVGKLKVFINWLNVSPAVGEAREQLEAYRGYINMKYSTAKSKNLYLSVVRSLYTWLFEEGIIKELPIGKIKNFPTNNEGNSKTALNKYQINDLLEHISSATGCNSERNRVIILLALQNGLRVNELVHIKLEDFSIVDDDHVIFLHRKGYDDKVCHTILDPKVYNLLNNFIGNRTEGYLFQSYRTKSILSSESMSRIIKTILNDAGVNDKRISPHSLRHSTATTAYRNGATVLEISKMLNHKSVSTTQTYLNSLSRSENPAEKRVSFDW